MKKPIKPKNDTTSADAIIKADQVLDARVNADIEEMKPYATAALNAILSNSDTIAALSIYAKEQGHPELIPSFIADSAWGYGIAMLNACRKIQAGIKELYKKGQPLPDSSKHVNTPTDTPVKPYSNFHGNN